VKRLIPAFAGMTKKNSQDAEMRERHGRYRGRAVLL